MGLLAVVAEIVVDQGGIEEVDAGGNGGVGREDVAEASSFERLVESETVFLHQDAHALDGQERGMAFVHVMDGWPDAELLERAQAADAEHDLLENALVN